MITEVSIRCQKTRRLVYGVYPRIPPNTPLRLLRKIDTAAFSADSAVQAVYGELELDADGYMLICSTRRSNEPWASIAPLLTGRRRCGQHDRRHLLDEA